MKSKLVPRLRFGKFGGEWRKSKLGDIAKVFDGTHQTPKYKDHGIPFVSVENILNLKTNKYISLNEFNKRFKSNKPKNGDILMSRIGSIGVDNIVTNTPLSFYVTLALIRPNLETLNPFFLMYLIKAPRFQRELWRRTLHVAFPQKINKNEIPKISILLASLPEQHAIGSFFAKLDRLIFLRHHKVALLKKLKRGYLQKMFPRKGSRVPRLRFGGFVGEWIPKRINDVAFVRTGYPFKSRLFNHDGKYLVITNSNIQNNLEYVSSNIGNRININNSKIIKRYQLNPGDILITMDGNVGRSAKVNNNKMLLAQRVARISSRDSNFIYYSSNTSLLKIKLIRLSVGGMIKHISLKNIKNIIIYFPKDVRELNSIGTFFKRLDDQINNQVNKLKLLKKFKHGYLQKMFV